MLDELYADIIVEAVESLVLFSAEREFQDDIVKQSKPLLVIVALALMRTSK